MVDVEWIGWVSGLICFACFDAARGVSARGSSIAAGVPRGEHEDVLHNLLSNALKFTTAGHVTLGVEQVDSEILISVSDSGTAASCRSPAPAITVTAGAMLRVAPCHADPGTDVAYGATRRTVPCYAHRATVLVPCYVVYSRPDVGRGGPRLAVRCAVPR
eukprot:1385247-Rhodomonas_salina.4